MHYCSVAGCYNNSGASKRGQNHDSHFISFHSFPRNLASRKAWAKRCGRKDNNISKTGVICSEHFLLSDFCQFHQFIAESNNSRQKRRLNDGVIPSLKLPTSSTNNTNANKSNRTERQEIKERKKLVEQLLADHEKESDTARPRRPAKRQKVIKLDQRNSRILKVSKQDNTTLATDAVTSEADSSSVAVPVAAQDIAICERGDNTSLLCVLTRDDATAAVPAAASSKVPDQHQDVEAIEPEEKVSITSFKIERYPASVAVEAAVSDADSVATAMGRAVFVTGASVDAGSAAAAPAAGPSDDDRSSFEDDGAAADSSSDDDESAAAPLSLLERTLRGGLSNEAGNNLSQDSVKEVQSVPGNVASAVPAADTLAGTGRKESGIRNGSKCDTSSVATGAAVPFNVPMVVSGAGLVTGANVEVSSDAAAPAASQGSFENGQRVSLKTIAPRIVPKVGSTIGTNIAMETTNTRTITFVSTQNSPEKKLRDATPSFCTRKTIRRSNPMAEKRAREIWRWRARVKKMEGRCRRALSVSDSPPLMPDGEKTDGVGEKTGGVGEQTEVTPASAAPAAAADDAAEASLAVRPDKHRYKPPTILTTIQQFHLTDSVAKQQPSDLQEAQDVNHRLKVQLLKLQAAMLKWAVKNEKLRDRTLKEAKQQRDHYKNKVVRGSRLRELLRLETAAKAMFTDSQIRAITRDHGDSSSSGLPAKRKCGQWGEEDLRRVLELRAISSDKVVQHVREKMKIPLPSMQATKLRCKKSPELAEAFREMLLKVDQKETLCSMCERQVNTIDEVIEAEAHGGVKAEYDIHFMNDVPPRRRGDPSAASRPKKRRRAPTATPLARKKARQAEAAAAALEWGHASDSDAELSDPGIWGRLAASDTDWQPDALVSNTPSPRKRAQPGPSMQFKKAWS